MSRTRLIRPEFFTDELMASASISTRFVYIGLWTLCDDAGYFEAKPRQIAAALFPYEGASRRQRIVDKAMAELSTLGRVEYLDCGLHGVVPTLPRHGQKGGNRAETYLLRHRAACPVRTSPSKSVQEVRPSTYESSSESVSDSGSVSGRVRSRVEKGADATKNGELTEFRQRVPLEVITGRPA